MGTAGASASAPTSPSTPSSSRKPSGLIEVTDVNQASLRLFAGRPQEAAPAAAWTVVLDAVSRAAVAETIVAIDEGRNDIEAESSAVTLERTEAVPHREDPHSARPTSAYPSMLVSLIDITARKEAEERERQSDDSSFTASSILPPT